MWKALGALIPVLIPAYEVEDLLGPVCDAWNSQVVLVAMWEAVDQHNLHPAALPILRELVQTESACLLGTATALAIFGALQPRDEYLPFLQAVLTEIFNLPGDTLSTLVTSPFPFFGALDWLSQLGLWTAPDCDDDRPYLRQYRAVLQHHLEGGPGTAPLPAIAALDFWKQQGSRGSAQGSLGSQLGGSKGAISSCFTGRAVASLSFLLTHSERLLPRHREASEADLGGGCVLSTEGVQLLQKAEHLLREELREDKRKEVRRSDRKGVMEVELSHKEGKEDKKSNAQNPLTKSLKLPAVVKRLLSREWKAAKILHEISRKLQASPQPSARDLEEDDSRDSCLILIYTFPTEEIRRDTREALKSLEENFTSRLEFSERPKMVVFVDQDTEASLETDIQPFTSLEVVPAVIPKEELTREMKSHICVGAFCNSWLEMPADVHRAKVDRMQYWSPAYLRISRYTAGPLFQHPQLDFCREFLKIDTDFFFIEPIEQNPLKKMRADGARLAYWQMQVQAQRQTGYLEASLSFLQAEDLEIRNPTFYARGLLERQFESSGIPLTAVQSAHDASTVLYGCLFGGDVQFFREPLYQSFFAFMDAQKGFENHGWSNQFLLGTAAAAFLPRPQLQKLYISGRHQECYITVADGNVTETLPGSEAAILR